MTTSSLQNLAPFALTPLPLGAIRPQGWLRDQLRVQADGLTGHLDEFWPFIADSRWIGGQSEGWERAPYWLDGLIPLAVLLQEERLLTKARRWIDHLLSGQHDDGWLGPREDPHGGLGEKVLDPWPLFILFKAFTQWQEATGDARIIPALLRCAGRLHLLLRERPLQSWAWVRWADLVVSLHWLYERTSEAFLLELAALCREQGFDWMTHFADFPYHQKTDPALFKRLGTAGALLLHGVNNAMGVKTGAVWARQSGAPADTTSSLTAIAELDKWHGQVTGMFSGDEHLAGRSPVQGTETCTVTEYLFTLEQLIALTGVPAIADRLERIAFNALPASMTKDMCARQYDQQPNQVLVSVAPRDWVSNGPHSNLFSLEGNFGCCTANLHQGWPKFASHLWMRTPDDGLAAVAYSPCTVTAEIAGTAVTLEEETAYPFRGEIYLTVRPAAPLVRFPLVLRIPEWANGATVQAWTDAAQKAAPGTFFRVEREWRNGDTITLSLPLHVRREPRDNGAVSLLRGPLVLALRMGEEFRQVGGTSPYVDWAVHPTTPWNYGLVEGQEADVTVQEAAITTKPFDAQAPPLIVTTRACRLPQWTMENDSAAPPPFSPVIVAPMTPVEVVELVPYGSTHLRISEFPVVIPGPALPPAG